MTDTMTDLQEAGIHPVIKANRIAEAKALNPLEPSDDWLESRSRSVGSSDIAGAIKGGSKYSNPSRLWEAKKRKIRQPPNNAMLAGSWLQPQIEELALEWLRQFYPAADRFPGAEQTFEAAGMAGMTCTPDLLVATNTAPDDDPNIPRGVIVEIKFTTNFGQYTRKVDRGKGPRDEFYPPDYVLRQVQHQLAIIDAIYGYTDYTDEGAWDDRLYNNGFDWAAAIAVFPVGYVPASMMGPGQHIVMSPAPILPSREMLAEMEQAGAAMLLCLKHGISPWNQTDDLLPAYYKSGDVGTPELADEITAHGRVVMATSEIKDRLAKLRKLEEEIKPDKKQIDEIKDQIKALLTAESADKLITEEGEVLASYSESDVLDWGSFCTDAQIELYSDLLQSVINYPEAAAKHTTPSAKTRRLSINRK